MEPQRKVKDRRLPVMIDDTMYEWVTGYAKERGVSASEVFRFAVEALRAQVEQARKPQRGKRSA
jgi:hypothetical protein